VSHQLKTGSLRICVLSKIANPTIFPLLLQDRKERIDHRALASENA